jgi:hypothetical protein
MEIERCASQPSRRRPADMTHMAIQEKLDGKALDWLEKVSDEQYRA